jgi:hypothetical protein
MIYSLFASSKQPSPNDFQVALSEYIKSPSSKELMAKVEENFYKSSSLTKADGSKLYTIVMANPFSMIYFLGNTTDEILIYSFAVTKVLSKN